MSENKIPIPARLYNAADGGHVAGAVDIIDDNKGKNQQTINSEVDNALSDRYTKGETYNKTELNNLITTPDVDYVAVVATDQTTDVTDVLPATGAPDTIYRVGSWDGTQYDPTVYSEYAWDGTNYKFLDKKEYTVANAEDFDNPNSSKRAKLPNVGAIVDVFGRYIDNPEFIEIKRDSEGKLIWAIKLDGSIYYGAGVPKQIQNLISASILAEHTDIIDYLITNYGKYIDNPEWLDVIRDSAGKILFGIDKNGNVILKDGKKLNKIIDALGIEKYVSYKRYKYASDKLNKSVGINIHTNTWDNGCLNGLVPALLDAGIQSIRSDISFATFVNRSTGVINFAQWDNWNYPLYKFAGWANKIDILSIVTVTMASGEEEIDHKPIPAHNNWEDEELWCNYVKSFAEHLDGRGITPTALANTNHETIPLKCNYFEICNELNVYFHSNDPDYLTLEDWFKIQRLGYESVKAGNKDAVVVFGGTSGIVTIGHELEDLFQVTYDDDGVTKHIWDYFDVYNYHIYNVTRPEALIDSIGKNIQLLEKYNINKPVWITESGYTTLEMSEYDQAVRTVRLYLCGLSLGVDRFFLYQMKEYEADGGDRESYFGIIHTSQVQTKIAFWKNDSSGKALSGYETLYVSTYSNNKAVLSCSNITLLNNLKNTGVKLTSERGYIKYVYINDTLIYTEPTNTATTVTLAASYFANLQASDKVYVQAIDGSNNTIWNQLDAKPAYNAVKQLTNMMPEGSTRPVIEKSNYYVATWRRSDNVLVKCFWVDNVMSDYAVKIEHNGTVYDYLGNVISTPNMITKEPFYISDFTNISINQL